MKTLELVQTDLYGKIEQSSSEENFILVDKMDLYIYLGIIQGVLTAYEGIEAVIAPGMGCSVKAYPSIGKPIGVDNSPNPVL